MSRIVMALSLTLGLGCLPLGRQAHAQDEPASTAFFYGPELPAELTRAYDRVVVEPGHGFDPTRRGPREAELVAYLSVGEVSRDSEDQAALDARWIAGDNPDWNSVVVDLANPALREHLLRERFEPLWQRGYRSFFLDTLDSYQRLEPARHAGQRDGLVALITAMHRRHPDAKLIANRGFEVLDRLAPHLSGLVAESLFDRFEAKGRRYTRVPESDRRWLLGQLRGARDQHGLAVTVIDYRPPHERAQARATAARIAALGFAPYVTDGALQGVGMGPFEVLPRRVWLLTNAGSPSTARPSRMLGPLLEYLGYVPEPHDISRALPDAVAGTLAGAIVWLEGEDLDRGYPLLLERLRRDGVPLVFIGDPRLDATTPQARALGLTAAQTPLKGELVVRGPLAQPDTGEPALAAQLAPLEPRGAGMKALLEVASRTGTRQVVIASMPWGGAALSHFLRPAGLHGEQAFRVDPLAFLTRALGGSEHPRPDLTTEDGRRLATVVVRAAGLARPSRMPGRPTHAALLQRLLRRHPVPIALDVQGRAGERVGASDRRIARELARSPHIALASPEPSTTLRLSHRGRLTELTRLLPEVAGGLPAMPLAGDYAYIPAGVEEAYPYARLAETLRRTDAPRRLCPAALDFHATSLGSPGGYRTVEGLLDALAGSDAQVVPLDGMAARARGFVAGVLLRHLDGGFELRASFGLRTVRLPVGSEVSARSRGVAAVHETQAGVFVSFAPGEAQRLYVDSAGQTLGSLEPGRSDR